MDFVNKNNHLFVERKNVNVENYINNTVKETYNLLINN